jgi:hypothetical protein
MPLTSLMINIMRRVQGTHGPTVRLRAHFLHLEWRSWVKLTIGSGESWAVYKRIVSIQSNGNEVSYLPEFRIHRAVFPERLNSNSSAVNKANKTSVNIHLPDAPETVAEQSQACEYCERLQGIVHSPRGPSSDREPYYGAQRESVEFSGAQTRRPSLNMDVVNKREMKESDRLKLIASRSISSFLAHELPLSL